MAAKKNKKNISGYALHGGGRSSNHLGVNKKSQHIVCHVNSYTYPCHDKFRY